VSRRTGTGATTLHRLAKRRDKSGIPAALKGFADVVLYRKLPEDEPTAK
jgi:hypothetical protein